MRYYKMNIIICAIIISACLTVFFTVDAFMPSRLALGIAMYFGIFLLYQEGQKSKATEEGES